MGMISIRHGMIYWGGVLSSTSPFLECLGGKACLGFRSYVWATLVSE